MRGQVFAVTLVVACGIATYVTMQSAYISLSEAQLDYYSAFRLADVFANAQARAGVASSVDRCHSGRGDCSDLAS